MRRIGVTDIETPPMVFGGNVFGWTADRETSFALLDRFADAGGTLVDTADVYSAWVAGHQGGESLFVLYLLIKKQGLRQGPRQGPMGQVYGKAPGAIFHYCLYCTCLIKRQGLRQGPTQGPMGQV